MVSLTQRCIVNYPLGPKMIILLFGFFCLKMIVCIICSARNLRQVEYVRAKFSISRSLLTVQLLGHFRVVFFYFKSHTYNYSVNGQRALVLPKLEAQTIILGWREYKLETLFGVGIQEKVADHIHAYWIGFRVWGLGLISLISTKSFWTRFFFHKEIQIPRWTKIAWSLTSLLKTMSFLGW